MKKERKKLYWAAVIILCSIYFSLLSVHIISLDKKALFNSDDLKDFTAKITDGWMYRYGDSPVDAGGRFVWLDGDSGWSGFEFPGRPHNPDGQRSIWIKGRLPQGNWSDPTLRFRAPQQALEIYLDGRKIYSFGKIDSANTNETPGSILHLVPLPPEFQGKEIYFRLYAPLPSYAGYLIEIEVGERSSHIINILKQNGLSLIFGSLFLFVGFVMILFSLLRSKDGKAVFFLGLSTFFLGCWNIAEGKTLQVFFNSPVAPVYIADISIFLMPIGFMIFMEQMFTREGHWEKLLFRRLWQCFTALFFLTFTADMAGVASNLNFNRILHLLIAFSLVSSLYIIIKTALAGNREAYIFAAGLIILGITGFYDTYIMFYSNSPNLNLYRISYWGMLAFVMSLIVIIMMRFSNAYESLMSDFRENEDNYKSIFNNMTDGFTFCRELADGNGTPADCLILDTNQAFTVHMGMGREELVGKNLLEIFPELNLGDITGVAAAGEAAAAEGQSLSRNIQLRRKWFRLSSFVPRDGYRSIIFTDITEMKNAEETITHQAYTDSMTGFFNRTYFEDIMARMGRMLPELKPLSFVVIDIDGLKITNDTFGHKVGDELLREAAKIISTVFESGGIPTRVGGDEFCIILPHTALSIVNEKREELVRLIDEANSAGGAVPISMSMGAATSEESEGEDIYDIYKRADDDMYQYKLSQAGSEKSRVIDMLLAALSEKDYVSQGHVERLAYMAEIMAHTLGLPDAEKRNLVLLSKVHDLGKIGIPDEILNKPGKLTRNESEKMKQHARIGYSIANRSKELVNIAPLILHHHERWDGKGYPDGLRDVEIPLECRILGIIDAYDAMTHDRPYHKGISREEALAEIERCSGTHFDPEIAVRFIEVAEKYRL